MTTPTEVPPQDALFQGALAHGFSLTKENATHRFVKKGSATFKLPIREDVNEFTRAAILRICAEVDERDRRSKGSRKPLPLAVNYQDETWAVFTSNAAQYNLQSLEDGRRIWVNKTEVEVVSEDELRIALPEPEPVSEAADIIPEVSTNGSAPKSFSIDQLEDLDPMHYWQTMTERQIENYTRRIDRLMEDLQPLLDRRDALQRAMAAAQQKSLAGSVTKRITLPSSGQKPKAASAPGKGVRLDKFAVERAKQLLRERPLLSNIEIAELVGEGVAATNVSYYRSVVKAESKGS